MKNTKKKPVRISKETLANLTDKTLKTVVGGATFCMGCTTTQTSAKTL